MKDYFTASEIAAAQGVSVRAVNKAASKGRWQLHNLPTMTCCARSG